MWGDMAGSYLENPKWRARLCSALACADIAGTMARFSPETLLSAHRVIGQACVAWTPDDSPSASKAYVERRGVAHLLVAAEHTTARVRMADVEFMAAFAPVLYDLSRARACRLV